MATAPNASLGSDDRIRKDVTPDSRDSRSNADVSRTDQDGTAFSAAERRTNFRDEWSANALPNPPAIPGYHLCWLSTTNTFDPIHKRIRMGYEPVRVTEVPGFEHYKMKSGEYEGMVSCNEMILFKCPEELYQEMMQYFHHEKPFEEESMIRQNQALTDSQAQKVAESREDDGFGSLAQNVPAPTFQ